MSNFYLWIKTVCILLLFSLIGMQPIKATSTHNFTNLFAQPVLGDDVFSTQENTPVSGDLLGNDYNPDGGNLNVVVVPFPPPTNGSVFISVNGTFSYTPNAGFIGVDQFSYRVCDDNDDCSIATVTIYVLPSGCTPTVDNYIESGCDSCTQVCLDIPLMDLENNYQITQNGATYYGTLQGCDFEATQAYTYFDLLGQGSFGPYDLNSWNIDGTDYTGTFNNPQELVDLMNSLDPAGNWFLNEPQLLIMGGSNTSTYSSMMVQNLAVANSFSTLTFNVQTIAFGSVVCLEPGMHDIAFIPLDGSCTETVANVTVTCVPTNNPPVANDDNYTIDEGEIFINNILINDNEPDGDPTTASLVTVPNNGTIMLGVNGDITYVPSAGFTGLDFFTYELCDDQGLCDQANVVFNVQAVNAPPVAQNDAYTIIVGATLNDNVLTNDSDPEGDPLTVNTSTVSGPQMGIVTLNADGTFTYLSPPTFEGVDQFTYEVCDNAGNCVQADVVITIQAANNPPMAIDDAYTTSVDIPLMDNVVSNDTDEDMTTIVASLVSQPSNGAVTLNNDGTFTYMPFAGYSGADQFTYEVCDTQGECAQAIVYITVEADCGTIVDTFTSGSCDSCTYVCFDIPFDNIDNYGITIDGVDYTDEILACNFDTVIAFTYFTLLGQGEQGPYEILSWMIDGVSHTGTFNNPTELMNLMNSIDPLGNWQLLPDAFVIYGGVETSTYSIMMVQNLAAEFSFSDIGFNEGVIANGSGVCVEGGNHIVEATLIGDTCPTQVIDATITCLVNDPPVAVDDLYSTTVDVSVNDDAMDNDYDPNGDAITVNTTLISQPSNGTVVIGSTGIFNYIPNTGFVGTDMFTYEICDGSGLCDQAVVTIIVVGEGNNPPVAIDDDYPTDVDIPVTENLMLNDTDPDGDVITANTTIVSDPSNGTVILNADGTFTYTPNAGFVGVDVFTYEICDTDGLCDEALVTITIAEPCDSFTADANIVNQPYCGFATGEVNVVATDGSGNYTYAWSDGGVGFSRNDLVGGVYGITVTDTDSGCDAITSVTLLGSEHCNDTITMVIPQALEFDTCLTALYDLEGTLSSAFVCHDDAMTVLLEVNQTDACINVDPNDSFIGTDTLCVYHCNDLGQCDTTIIIIEIEPNCEADFLAMENEMLVQADSCNGTAQLCFPIPFGEFQNYQITDNGTVTTAGIAGCDFDTIITYNYFTLIGDGEVGPYMLDSWTVDGQTFSGEFQNISDLVDSMNIWNPLAEWTLDADAELIIGVSGGTDYSEILITHLFTNSNFSIGFNIGEFSNGTFIELEVGLHEVIVTDLVNGCMDTVQVEVYCLMENIIYDTLVLGTDGDVCFSLPTGLPGNVDLNNITNTCSDASGNEVTFQAATNNGTDVCLNYSSVGIGTDTACITVCDDLGICETTTVIVTVIPTGLTNIVDTVFVGNTEVVCTDDFDYMGTFDTVSNACPELGSESVIFNIDEATGCVMYTGLEIGTDTACVVFCDELSQVCDTAYIYVHVLDTTNVVHPIAMNDTDSTMQDVPVMIDVIANDTVNGVLQTIIVTDNPNSGTAIVSGDSTIIYMPSQGFCGLDSFTYMICNETSCDTATVLVDVECSDLYVYNAMSPNGDGVNDHFFIAGIAQYDRVTVSVFNRWGNMVYESRDRRYTNDFDDEGKGPWDGTWNGQDLPDGTYFYCIELPDGLGRRTGYVQVQR